MYHQKRYTKKRCKSFDFGGIKKRTLSEKECVRTEERQRKRCVSDPYSRSFLIVIEMGLLPSSSRSCA